MNPHRIPRKRKRNIPKGKAQQRHAVKRLAERHGIFVSRESYEDLVQKIQNGKARFIDKQSCRISRYVVRCQGQDIFVAYDCHRHTIVTVLPPWVLEDLEKRACIEDDSNV